MNKKVLHLTLKRKWFDLIATGKKKEECREIKDYWKKRFFDNHGEIIKFDAIHFRNGYSSENPTMIVEWKGLDLGYNYYELEPCYAIQLGNVLEIKNWPGLKIVGLHRTTFTTSTIKLPGVVYDHNHSL